MKKKDLTVKFSPAFILDTGDPLDYSKINEPQESKKYIPSWYKKLSKFHKSNSISKLHPVNDRGTDGSAASTKLCMPFFDALTSGYMYTLDYDLHIKQDKNGFPVLSWEGDNMIVDKRLMIDVPVPTYHHPMHYGWKVNWYSETPKGYSLLITHPLNRHDLPFTTMSGIIDADLWHTPVFTSFFLKKNFIGIIPKGTPIFQMIPIKREEWSLEIDYSNKNIEENQIKDEKRRSLIYAYYKNIIWQRKQYRGKI
jgi:hypothetical protein